MVVFGAGDRACGSGGCPLRATRSGGQCRSVTDGDVAIADLDDPLALETLEGPCHARPGDAQEIGDRLLREVHHPRPPRQFVVKERGDAAAHVTAQQLLESVRIESVNLNDTDAENAVYRFGRVVHEIRDTQGFTLKGFNVDTRAQGERRSARLTPGAVADEAGESNLPGFPSKGT
jgi:hypothetical protein